MTDDTAYGASPVYNKLGGRLRTEQHLVPVPEGGRREDHKWRAQISELGEAAERPVSLDTLGRLRVESHEARSSQDEEVSTRVTRIGRVLQAHAQETKLSDRQRAGKKRQ